MTIPVIILLRPQLGENIGAVARAMMNFGLSELRVVAPRDGWPNPRAIEVASGAGSIIEAATLFATLPEAAHDIHRLYATTARPRDMAKRVVTPEEAMKEICGFSSPWKGEDQDGGLLSTDPHPALPLPGGGKIALVFGPERTGLENEEIAFCDTIVTIPTSPEHPSLNIAQSAVVMGYEWFKQSSEFRVQSSEKNFTEFRTPNSDHSLATKGEMAGLFEQLEKILDESNYYRIAHKKPIMWQNMQTMLLRGQWSSQEVQSFRGMLRVIWEGRKPRR